MCHPICITKYSDRQEGGVETIASAARSMAEAMKENPKKRPRKVSGVDTPDKKQTQHSEEGLKSKK